MELSKEKLAALVEEVRDSLIMNLVQEGGFSRLRQIMLGQVPSVNSIGILTAENPQAQASSPQENNARNEELKATLRQANYSFIPITGKYGGKEKSFVVPHLSRTDAVSFGSQFQQEAVIWGEKISDLFDDTFFRFEFIEGGVTKDTRNVSLGDTEAQKRQDFYSEKAGRKFYIPFFDDEDIGEATASSRESFMESEIPELAEAEMLVESIQKRNSFLSEKNRTLKSKWTHRALIKKELRSLERIVSYHNSKK
tara:strand:+ start:139 stop:897 length:759 start_codon:yes stop_codon:yes gene_type:complete